MKVLLIDNYDSFTYNLVHYLEELDCEVTVFRNDSIALVELDLSLFHGLVLSPGPGLPENNGFLMAMTTKALGNIPILGVCLGMQALGILAGSALYNKRQYYFKRCKVVECWVIPQLGGRQGRFRAFLEGLCSSFR